MVPLNSNNNVSGSNNNHSQQQQQMTTAVSNAQQVQQQQSTVAGHQANRSHSTTTQTPVALINGLNNGVSGTQQPTRHHSSSENSEQSLDNCVTAGIKNGNETKRISNPTKSETEAMMIAKQQLQVIPAQQQQQKTILLKFPQNLMETDQLIVSD